jgi:hypothetical protein
MPVVRHRWLRSAALLSGGAGLLLALGAAAPADAAAAMPMVAGARAAASGGTWGNAQEVAGALNQGGEAQILSVSCARASSVNCSAGGYYAGPSGQQAFVVTEQKGKWGTAQEVAAALDTSGGGEVNSVACASAGTCSAGGVYSANSRSQAFVVNES